MYAARWRSPAQDVLASSDWKGSIFLWDPETGKELRHLVCPEHDVRGIAFSSDGKLLAGIGNLSDKSVFIWEVATGRLLHCLKCQTGTIYTIAFSPKGAVLAAGGNGGVSLWDADSGKELRVVEAQSECIGDITFNPDGSALAGLVSRGPRPDHSTQTRVWETSSGKLLHELNEEKNNLARRVHYSKDGKVLITMTFTGACLWDTATGNKIEAPGQSMGRSFDSAISRDGKLLVIRDGTNTIQLWDWAVGRLVRNVGTPKKETGRTLHVLARQQVAGKCGIGRHSDLGCGVGTI